MKEDVRQEGCRRIARKVGSPALAEGLDWVVGRRLLASYAAKGDSLQQKGLKLKAVWQGSLVHCANSSVDICPKCNVEASWRHILIDCQWWRNKGFSLPSWYSPGAELGSKLSWLRGLRCAANLVAPSCCECTSPVAQAWGKEDSGYLSNARLERNARFNDVPRLDHFRRILDDAFGRSPAHLVQWPRRYACPHSPRHPRMKEHLPEA